MFSRLGPLELGLILLIILMVFGVGKLPQVGASLGKAIRAFRQGASGDDEEEKTPKITKRTRKRVAKRTASKVTGAKPETETGEIKTPLDESAGKLSEAINIKG